MKKKNIVTNLPQKWGNLKSQIQRIASKYATEEPEEEGDEIEVPLNLTIYNEFTKIDYAYPEIVDLSLEEVLADFEEDVDLRYSLWLSDKPDTSIRDGVLKQYKIIESNPEPSQKEDTQLIKNDSAILDGLNAFTQQFFQHIHTIEAKKQPSDDSRYIQTLEREKEKLEQAHEKEKSKLEQEIKDLSLEIKNLHKEYQAEINRLKEKVTELQLLTVTNSKTDDEMKKIMDELEKAKKDISIKDKKLSEIEKKNEIREIETRLKIKKETPDEVTEKTRQILADKLPDIIDAGIGYFRHSEKNNIGSIKEELKKYA